MRPRARATARVAWPSPWEWTAKYPRSSSIERLIVRFPKDLRMGRRRCWVTPIFRAPRRAGYGRGYIAGGSQARTLGIVQEENKLGEEANKATARMIYQ